MARSGVIRTSVPVLVAAVVLGVAVSACGSGHSGATAATRPPPRAVKPALPGTGRPQVTIGDKNFTEQFLLGDLYQQALIAKGFAVMLNPNIGPTEVTLQALQSGRLDMYPEYLGTWNSAVAGYARSFASAGSALRAARAYATAHGLALLHPTPFSDTDAIGVTRAYAVNNDLRTIGDLRRIAPAVTLGGPPQFQQSPGGLPAVEEAYGFVPAAFKALDVGAQYQALAQGSVQAADVNTTDGQLAGRGYRLLSDPEGVFGWGNVVPVVPAKVLAVEGPAFAETIDSVSALLTTRVMRGLNAAVDIYHEDPAAVARQFLESHGLVLKPT
jgi:osmoprotectant transport system substrate-binding protein